MTIRIVSYSELDTMRQCPLKHELAYVHRYTKKQPPDSALSKGTMWHAVLEAHYRTIQAAQREDVADTAKLLKDCRLAAEQVLDNADPDLADLGWWMYDGFTSLYGTDEDWRILAVEHNATCRLLTPRGTRSGFYLKMKIDVVIKERRTGNIKVVDHKSGKDLPSKKSLDLDDQFGLYTWGLRQMGKKVFGQVYDAARTTRLKADVQVPGTTPLDERYRRIPLYRTDKELTQVALEAYLSASARYRQQAEVNKLGIESPRHTNPQTCSWRCDFEEACLFGRKAGVGRTHQFLRDQGFVQDFTRH